MEQEFPFCPECGADITCELHLLGGHVCDGEDENQQELPLKDKGEAP